MAERVLTLRITGKPEDAIRALEAVGIKSEEVATKSAGHFDKATTKIGNLFHGLDNQLGAFGIPFTGALGKMGDKIDGLSAKGEGFAQKMLPVFGGLGLGVAAVAGGIAVESIHLADSFEIAQSRLETAVKNAGGNFKAFEPAIQSSYDKMAQFGYNATETAGALATLTGLTGSPIKALSLMGDTANFAARYNKDLAFSAQAVGLAAEGQMGKLKRLVGDLGLTAGGTTQVAKAQHALTAAQQNSDDVQQKVNDGRLKGQAATDALTKAHEKLWVAQQTLNDKTAAGSSILQALHQRDMGAAEARSKTFAGAMQGLQANLENVGIKIGLFLIPYVKQMATALGEAVAWVNAHRADFAAFFDDVAQVVQRVWTVVGPIYTALWEQLQAVFGLIDDLIRGNWSAIWDDFLAILHAAFDLVVAPVIGLYHLFQGTFDDIGNAVGDAVNTISGYAGQIWGVLVGTIGGAVSWLQGAWHDTWQTISDIAGGVAGGISGALQPIIDVLRSIIDFAGQVKDAIGAIPNLIGGGIGAVGGFLGLSEGGFVPGVGTSDSVPAMLTPGEFVVSKDMMRNGVPHGLSAAVGGGRAGAGGGGGSNNTYNLSGLVVVGASKADVGRQLAELLQAYQVRAGTSWQKVGG